MIRIALLGMLLVACSKEVPEREPHGATHGQASVAAPRRRPAALTKVTIKALGMYCEESCPLNVRTALAAVPAVYELGFDVSTESIFVSYDASLGTAKDVTRPMLVAIRSAGFDPWLAKEAWPDDASAQVITR